MNSLPVEHSIFYSLAACAKKILIVDLGMLGDGVHLLPALWQIRQAHPKAYLAVIIETGAKNLFATTPWIDEVISYPRFSKRHSMLEEYRWIRTLRRKKFDLLFNFSGSQRSGIISRLSGCPLRLGRIHPGLRRGWTWYYTHPLWVEPNQQPIYRMRLLMLNKSGYQNYSKPMPLTLPPSPIKNKKGQWIHVSPFATSDYKELPDQQKIKVFSKIMKENPEVKFVFSCSPSEREMSKMTALLSSLPKPDLVFPGTLQLNELASLIAMCDVHLGGDSGAMHLAWLTGTPSLTWFRPYKGLIEWEPSGIGRESLVGNSFSDNGIDGISNEAISIKFNQLLSSKQNASLMIDIDAEAHNPSDNIANMK